MLNSTNVSGWWFGTWLDYFPFHRKGMSSFPLTNSIIFQDGHIAPPTRYFCWGWTANQVPAILATLAFDTKMTLLTLQVRRTPSISATLSRQVRCFWASVFLFTKVDLKTQKICEDIIKPLKVYWYDMIWYDMISYHIYDIWYMVYDIWYMIWLLYMKVQLFQYVSIKY